MDEEDLDSLLISLGILPDKVSPKVENLAPAQIEFSSQTNFFKDNCDI